MRRSRSSRLVLAGLLALPLVACSSAQDATEPAAAEGPAAIEHVFGETAVPADPQRVVTWGWGSTDAAIALGVVPVAMPTQTYGGDERGVLPWIAEALDAAGKATPELLPDAQEPPIEAIAAAKPDLILAPYSGITQGEYDLLSQIAPTVAYPGEAWATAWRETIEIVGAALGRTGEADALLADIDAQVAAEAAEHPELEDKSVAMVWDTADVFYVYKPADARVAFTTDLGLTSAASVDSLASGEETFYFTLSKERLAELDSDVLVAYADTKESAQAFLASPEAQLMEQVRTGAVAPVIGTELIAAVSPPTALSLTWGLKEYADTLAKAAAAADTA